MDIFAVDWGKDLRKRAAFVADSAAKTVSKLDFDGSLPHLYALARQRKGPVLIGIDAAIGYPMANWSALSRVTGQAFQSFTEFLFSDTLPESFFRPVREPIQWKPEQPFIQPPVGHWSREAFNQASNHGLMRPIDVQLKSNPLFIMSGMPGTVGSGTMALWKELIEINRHQTLNIWPFAGDFKTLSASSNPIIAEIYPKACYGIALTENLPARLLTIGKTRAHHRDAAIKQLLDQDWLKTSGIKIKDLELAYDNEDDFDAMMSAVALLRLAIENASFESQPSANAKIEGGILGASNLTGLDKTGRFKAQSMTINTSALKPETRPQKSPSTKAVKKPLITPDQQKATRQYHCPIPGCSKVFYNSRGGWDSHVEWSHLHPDWHPEIQDRHERKKLFKQTFTEFFKK